MTGNQTRQRSLVESMVPVDVISAGDVAHPGETNLDMLLRNVVPSLNISSVSGDGATIVRPVNLRGLASDHTLVLVNGKRRHRGAVILWSRIGESHGAQGPDPFPGSARLPPATGTVRMSLCTRPGVRTARRLLDGGHGPAVRGLRRLRLDPERRGRGPRRGCRRRRCGGAPAPVLRRRRVSRTPSSLDAVLGLAKASREKTTENASGWVRRDGTGRSRVPESGGYLLPLSISLSVSTMRASCRVYGPVKHREGVSARGSNGSYDSSRAERNGSAPTPIV